MLRRIFKLNPTESETVAKGYTKQQDDGEEAKGWHVVTNGDEVREGRHEVEEVGLVQALQEIIQLTIHSFQEPREYS